MNDNKDKCTSFLKIWTVKKLIEKSKIYHRRRRFPPKVRRLTEEEYIQQGNFETRKALEELRNFCHSPQCDAWKTVSRLRSPQRSVMETRRVFFSSLLVVFYPSFELDVLPLYIKFACSVRHIVPSQFMIRYACPFSIK